MDYSEHDEQEYMRFVAKVVHEGNEITKEYNKLSDKNKSRVSGEAYNLLICKLIYGWF